MSPAELNAISRKTLNAAFRVHSKLGPGLLESAYVACLAFELRRDGLDVRTEVSLPLVYEGEQLADVGYRIDILIENELILEVKALEAIAPVHVAQLVSYLRLSNKRLGFLLNFNVVQMKKGIYRRVNQF